MAHASNVTTTVGLIGSREGREAREVEPFLLRWKRRTLTFTGMFLACAVVWASLPVWLVIGAVVDVLGRRRWATLRCMAMVTVLFTCEVLGLLAGGALWLGMGGPVGRRDARWLRAHFAVQQRWASVLYGAFCGLYGVKVTLEGATEVAGDGERPVLVFARHASIADTLLPSQYISSRHGIRLRYVLKRELLWDPCMDLFGQRLPNYFVARDSQNTHREVRGVVSLTAGMGRREGVMIFPEGTRFTPEKRARVIARLEEKGDERLLAWARGLKHTLPPRLGGAMGLLSAGSGADVVVLGHVGLEAVTRLDNLIDGGLIGTHIRIRMWRYERSEIPTDVEGREAWLMAVWAELDRWVGEQI